MKLKRKPFDTLIQDRLNGRLPGGGMTVLNADGPKATIRIYDEISKWWGVSAEQVAAQLDEITADEIEVQIASLGGDVFEGVAIYNALRSHPAKITTRVDSMAASIASVIAQAGDHRVMLTGSQMMIHEAWGFTVGSADDHRQTAVVLDKQTDIIADIYAERADGDAEAFRTLMEGETWMDASEAVENGLADEVVKPAEQPQDRWNTPRFSDQLRAVVTAVEQVTEETENVMTFRSEQGKPPLSDDAVALLEALGEALDRLLGVLTPEADISDEAEREFLRFVESTL